MHMNARLTHTPSHVQEHQCPLSRQSFLLPRACQACGLQGATAAESFVTSTEERSLLLRPCVFECVCVSTGRVRGVGAVVTYHCVMALLSAMKKSHNTAAAAASYISGMALLSAKLMAPSYIHGLARKQ